jgi:hypothetical protein
MAFAVEEIPDHANLFRKIHWTHYDGTTGVVSSAAFRQERMSVNWEKYMILVLLETVFTNAEFHVRCRQWAGNCVAGAGSFSFWQ